MILNDVVGLILCSPVSMIFGTGSGILCLSAVPLILPQS